MKYSEDFKALLFSTTEDYIGHGNPNAKILFLGQEAAIDRDDMPEQYDREIAHNAQQWRELVSIEIGYESIDQSGNNTWSPLHPYPNQKFQIRSVKKAGADREDIIRGEEGTSTTWFKYQKLIQKIFELANPTIKPMTKDDQLNFHRLSFHTDMSAVTFKKHKDSAEGGRESVKKRESLLSSDFFRKFPIVIAAVGHFPKETFGNEGDKYFGNVFGVHFIGNEETEGRKWMNVNIRMDKENPRLLIHTPQFSYTSVSDRYIDHMAFKIVEFAREHNIDLRPKE